MSIISTLHLFHTSSSIHKILRLLELDELQIYEVEGKNVVDLFGKKGLGVSLEESDVYGDQTAVLTIEGGTLTLADLNGLLNLSNSYAGWYAKMGLKEVSLEAYASERNDYEYLSVGGQVDVGSDVWQLLGTEFPITDLKFSAYVTHQSGSYRKNYQVGLTAQIALEGHQLEVYIEIATGQEGIWTLRYSDVNTGEEDKRFFTLKNLMKLFGKTDGLPKKIEGLSSVGLDELTITFNPEQKQLYRADLAISSSESWPLIKDGEQTKLALYKVGLRLSINAIEKTYQGHVHAEARLGGLEASADIPLPMEGDLKVNLHTPKSKPSLSDFNDLLDGEQIESHLPNTSTSKLSFELSQLKVIWDLNSNTLKEVDLQLSCTKEGKGYEVWNNHLYLQQFNLDLQLKKIASWQSSGSIHGKGTIEEAEVSVRLDKRIDGSWQVYLTDPIYFGTGLAGVKSLTSFNLADQKNDALPAKIIEEAKDQSVLRRFRVHFDPQFQTEYVSIYFETKGQTHIYKNKVILQEAAFLLQANHPFDSAAREIVAAQLGGQLAIGEHQIRLISEKNDANAYWTFIGKSQAGDKIPVTELFIKLLRAIGVDQISADELPEATISDLELTYVPEVRKLDFSGKSQLTITEAINADLDVSLNYKGEEYLTFDVESTVWIADRVFHLTADYKTLNDAGWFFSADMEGEVSPAKLLRAALTNTKLDFPDVLPVGLSVSDVHFESRPRSSYFKLTGNAGISIELIEGWPLLLHTSLRAERPETQPGSLQQAVNIDATASADFPIYKKDGSIVHLKLEGRTLGDKNGWELHGGMDGDLSLADIIHTVQEHLDIGSELPTSLVDLKVTRLEASLNTYTWKYDFTTEGTLAIAGTKIGIHSTLNVWRLQNGTMQRKFAGQLLFGSGSAQRVFELNLNKEGTTEWMTGTYEALSQDKVSLADLYGSFLPQIGNWSIALQDAIVLIDGFDTSRFLLATHIGNGIDLSALPLIGKLFPGSKQLTVDYELIMSSQNFAGVSFNGVNSLLPEGVRKLKNSDEHIKRLSLEAKLSFAGKEKVIDLPITISETDESQKTEQHPESPVKVAADQRDTSVKWFSIQQNIGPVHFGRIGIRYDAVGITPRIEFMLDASLNTKGLTIELEGLSVISPMTHLDPTFNLDGLSVDFRNRLVEIGAGLLRERVPNEGGEEFYEFNGTAVIRIRKLSISAIGSYADLDGHPSMFVYAAMNVPLGGPPFFFVTGLSAGFGYNRRLILPTVDKVLEFPLLADAVIGKALPADANRDTLMTELNAVKRYIPTSQGDIFLAAGLSFTTFRLINSVVLLTATVGDESAFNLLGESKLNVPPLSEKPLAKVQMVIKGAFLPDEGFAGISGQLTSDSYVLSRDCHLTGGFAFYSWFSGDHSGDFVMTVGGYHPDFQPPAHYPTVPRLGIRWELDKHTLVKGEAYFALCANAVMAGGLLEATYHNGGLNAWFKASADFLMAWKPFHYEAKTRTHIGGSYTFKGFWGQTSLSVDLGTEIEFWGPDFGGIAKLNLYVTSVAVSFGSKREEAPPKLTWVEFKNDFLPENNLCKLSPNTGLLASSDETLGLFSASEFSLTLNNVVPSHRVSVVTDKGLRHLESENHEWQQDLGIRPMGLSSGNFTSTLEVLITDESGDPISAEHFDFKPIFQSVPGALWSGTSKPDLQEEPFIKNALMGLEIKSTDPSTHDVLPRKVQPQKLPERTIEDWNDWVKKGYEDLESSTALRDSGQNMVLDIKKSPGESQQESDETGPTRVDYWETFQSSQSTRSEILSLLGMGGEDFHHIEEDWLELPTFIEMTS